MGNDACSSCTANATTSGTGSTAITQCLCSAGYSGNASVANGTCTICAKGTYKGVGNATSCTTCPSNSTTSSTGSASQASCICNKGYGGNASTSTGTCTACTPGNYKAADANSNCTAASTGHYVSGSAQTAEQACAKGSYTNTTGQSSCTQCNGAEYQSETGKTSCTACPAAEAGWTAGTGKGWTSYTDCNETQKPANCASGTIQKKASSASAWGAASVSSALTANTGYYVNSTACSACTNKPDNSTYTSAGTSATTCQWSCNNGYGKTFQSKCVLKCTAGISTLHAGDKVSVQLYDTKSTTPSIVVQKGTKMCYGNLTTGSGTNALNVTYKDATYHTVN